jgi:hypothetical protein
MLLGASSRSPDVERPGSPKYSERLSPSVNAYLSEASRHEIRVSFIRLPGFPALVFFNYGIFSGYNIFHTKYSPIRDVSN